MNLWYVVPELCPCGGVAALRLEEGFADEPDEVGRRVMLDWLLYACPSCGLRGPLALTEAEAAASWKRNALTRKTNPQGQAAMTPTNTSTGPREGAELCPRPHEEATIL